MCEMELILDDGIGTFGYEPQTVLRHRMALNQRMELNNRTLLKQHYVVITFQNSIQFVRAYSIPYMGIAFLK